MFYVVINEAWDIQAFKSKGEATRFIGELRASGNRVAYLVKGM